MKPGHELYLPGPLFMIEMNFVSIFWTLVSHPSGNGKSMELRRFCISVLSDLKKFNFNCALIGSCGISEKQLKWSSASMRRKMTIKNMKCS